MEELRTGGRRPDAHADSGDPRQALDQVADWHAHGQHLTVALSLSASSLAHSLGPRMVAAGVENKVAYAELTRLGCDQAQGSFMSGPVPVAELNQWLRVRAGAESVRTRVRPRT